MSTDLSNLENFLDLGVSIRENTNKNASTTIDAKIDPTTIRNRARSMGIDTEPLDIYEVATKLFSMHIREEDLGKSISGFLERIGEQWCIYINKYESSLRKRFTIAHELGHFILHRNQIIAQGASAPDQIFFRSDDVNSVEQEANNFASELLMPEKDFKCAIQTGDNTLEKLSKKFELSTMAVKYRAYKLGIISEYK